MVPTGQLKDSAPSPNPPKPTSTELDHQQDPSGHRTMIQDAIDDAAMNRIDHDTEEAIRRFLVLLDGRYSVARTILYGSRARGTHRPDSDADVAVLLNGEHQRFLTTKLEMADVAYEVLLETGIHISPLPVWLDEWEHPETYANPALLHNIAREGFTCPPIAAASVPDPQC